GFMTSEIQAIAAQSPDNVVITGHGGGNGTSYSHSYSIMFVWNGKQWTRLTENDLAASGLVNPQTSIQTPVQTPIPLPDLSLQGRELWNEGALPPLTATLQIKEVSARPGGQGNDAWASGSTMSDPDNPNGPTVGELLLHWDGSKWSSVPTPKITMPG